MSQCWPPCADVTKGRHCSVRRRLQARASCFMQVVCPLIALAKDQVEHALARNIDAEMFNSEVQVNALQPLCNHDALKPDVFKCHPIVSGALPAALFTLTLDASMLYGNLLRKQAHTALQELLCVRF